MTDEWKNINREARAKFYADNANTFGDDLALTLEETVAEAKTSVDTHAFNSDANFIDEIDLKEKYRDKPAVLEAVMRNAQKMYCPIREITLYAVPEYNRKNSEVESVAKTQKRGLELETIVKPKKQSKNHK